MKRKEDLVNNGDVAAKKKKTKSRQNGEGTIYDKVVKKKRKNGEEYELKYVEAQIMINNKRCTKTFKGKREASAWLQKKREEASKGIYIVSNKVKFKEFADTWLKDKEIEGKKETTLSGWRLYLDNHILPSLGSIALKDITTEKLNSFYSEKMGTNSQRKRDSKTEEKKNEPISPNTVIHFHRIIHNILNHAIKHRILAYNPATACSKPKAVKPQINILTVEEVVKLLETARLYNIKKNGEINEKVNQSYYPALVVAVYTGLRRSELMGLKWKYVDLDNGILTITETLLQITGKKAYQEDDTKTYAGKRTIAVPSEVIEILSKHKEYMGDTEYVFCNNKRGTPDPHNFNRFFEKLLVKAGIEKHVRIHDLRHTNVSMMVLQGVNPKDISKRIGHSSYSFTMQTYAHIMPETDMKTAEKLSELLQKSTEKPTEIKG
ncbi:tyrosine-type recombinase/integrase [Pelosinus propionicus]|uniref:Site-specific recombinase XerD n=1 Tax=Pelosinus propionicus DSM 13327 TaxID=1123291 RepID=A0A1I4JHF4_9FIRM|nr:site-specific integrase [Pelosinus propionicus]SFL66005.1 Site-specific recombinase XerD [Pelosinus propionicus DSM 13327]